MKMLSEKIGNQDQAKTIASTCGGGASVGATSIDNENVPGGNTHSMSCLA